MDILREKIARAIADGLGDDFNNAFVSKSEWNAERGQKGGRYRDVNEPFQSDYLEAADAILAIPELKEALEMVEAYKDMVNFGTSYVRLSRVAPEDVFIEPPETPANR